MQRSSGEAATAVGMARELVRRDHAVDVLASTELARSIRSRIAVTVHELGRDLAVNEATARRVVDDFEPSHVIFADFPMMAGFSSGAAPLDTDRWVEQLRSMHVSLFTLDHLGYGQGPVSLYFGPPHLSSHPERIPALPEAMQILLPCPIHEPGPVGGRRGTPFRVACPPPCRDPEAVRARVRARLGVGDEPLVLHAVSQWTRDFCRVFGLAYYSILPRLLQWYFTGAPRAVVIVSVNGAATTPPIDRGGARVVALDSMDERAFGELVASCDLFLNENPFSSTLGRMVVEGVPAACLVNSRRLTEIHATVPPPLRALALELEQHRTGSVFPYRVLPLDFRAELQATGLFRDNRFGKTFLELEAWGGEDTREQLWRLLWDAEVRRDLREHQAAYGRALEALPGAHEVLGATAGSLR